MNKESKLKSRKLWAAIVSAALIVANEGLGLGIPAEAVWSIAGVAGTYIFGQAMVDAAKEKNKL